MSNPRPQRVGATVLLVLEGWWGLAADESQGRRKLVPRRKCGISRSVPWLRRCRRSLELVLLPLVLAQSCPGRVGRRTSSNALKHVGGKRDVAAEGLRLASSLALATMQSCSL